MSRCSSITIVQTASAVIILFIFVTIVRSRYYLRVFPTTIAAVTFINALVILHAGQHQGTKS